jgi:hypothetical protein
MRIGLEFCRSWVGPFRRPVQEFESAMALVKFRKDLEVEFDVTCRQLGTHLILHLHHIRCNSKRRQETRLSGTSLVARPEP